MNRLLLFIFVCLLIRILFVVITKTINKKYLPYLGYLALLPGLGFLIIYFCGLRKRGIETGGELIWWNELRPIHGILYLSFSYLAINKSKLSYIPLLLDVLIGIIGKININNTFNI